MAPISAISAAAWAALSLDDQVDTLRSYATSYGRALSTGELSRALTAHGRNVEGALAQLRLPPMAWLAPTTTTTTNTMLRTAPRPSAAAPATTPHGPPTGSALTTTLIGTPRAGEIEDEIAVRLEALERASLELEEQREELERAAQAAERREARRAETADLMAQELADLQSVLEGQEPPGPAVVRLARERTTALEALLPAQRRAAELEEDLEEAYQQIERLRVRNAALLDRERKRRGVG
jgi:DNA repair exonuclease SbcCD ATPase subunit